MILAGTSDQSLHPPPYTASGSIHIYLADGHPITLWGLHQLIQTAGPHMTVVGSATTQQALLSDAAATHADVILLDLDLAGPDAAQALARLRQQCRGHVLVLTASKDMEQQRTAVLTGARGMVHKSEPASAILRAIETVGRGEVWLDRRLVSHVLGHLSAPSRPASPRLQRPPADPQAERIASLTARERSIIHTLVHSAGAKLLCVAHELQMSEHTLRNHLTSIYSKLCVRGRLELHLFATAHGLAASEDAARPSALEMQGGRNLPPPRAESPPARTTKLPGAGWSASLESVA